MNGHVPNDANRHDDFDSIDDCAQKCTEEKQACASFEFSPSQRICQVNDVKMVTDPPLEDFAFCIKSGEYFILQQNNLIYLLSFL